MIILASVLLVLIGAIVYEGINLDWSAEEVGNIVDYGAVRCLIGHSWENADCTRPRHCIECGSTRGIALGHEWISATCTEARHCRVCGKTEGEALGHSWVSATCTEAKTCSVCGETEGKPEGHTWVSATCKQPRHCRICGQEEGKLADHQWAAATCTSAKKCLVCGLKQGSALGHEYVEYICSRCKEQKSLTAGDIPKILDITTLTYKVNSVGGIEHTMAFTNKSSKKTIKYIDLEFEMYNRVGDVITNEINRSQKTERCTYVGPLSPGKNSGKVYWSIDFYNSAFSGTMHFLSIVIEYTDGSKLTLDKYIAGEAVVSWR